MPLIIDNPSVEQVLSPSDINQSLELAARELALGGAVNAPPYRVLTPRTQEDYGAQFPEGGSPTHHAFTSLTGSIASLNVTADRVDSDIITYVEHGGSLRQRRVPGTPDRKFCGLLYLYSSVTGELLAMIHDGYLQKFRVAGTAAVGAKYLARHDARVVALLGTGWQAQAAVHCFAALERFERIEVFSPTPGKKESFAKQMTEEAGIEVVPASSGREAVRGSDVVYMATNSKDPVVCADWLEPGQFVSNVSDVELELAGWERCDLLAMNRHGRRWMRYAIGGVDVIPEHGRDQYTRSTTIEWDRLPLLGDVIAGIHPGRTDAAQITGLVLRGDGVQFAAVGHRIYELCKERGLGTELPRELFLQDESYIP